LGEIPPARSRQQGRRSAVAISGDRAVVGTADGGLLGFDLSAESPRRRWRHDPDSGEPSIVAAVSTGGENPGWLVGERSARGAIRCHDADGSLRWRYDSHEDVGEPQEETRFLRPFVASLATADGRFYAAARRYERGDDGERTFRSRVYAFDPDGSVAWSYRADASPISVSVRGDRVAVAYNRCPGNHQRGLVVLDGSDGTVQWTWDPGTESQRRVGDVALLGEGAVVTSHGDYCGYRVADGETQWRLPLATPTDIDGETVYAYPNHVHATSSGAVFVTGNTYPEDGRETAVRHPQEHTATGVSLEGEKRWSSPVGGFASGLGTDGDLFAVPGAQHFRDRDAEHHGLRLLDVAAGHVDTVDTPGIVTAASVSGETAVAIEEPVVYHDEGVERGAYRLHQLD